MLTVIATSFKVAGVLAAVVITDSFQSILMIGASAALTIIGLYKVGGLDKLINSVPADYWTLFRPTNDPEYPWHAIVLGYPVMGIWFWCTDQTIVQRVLGARDIKQGQLGAIFAGFLKVLAPLIFFLPGILCKILHPNIPDPEMAYVTMVEQYMPIGMVGLIIAVLIAALISTLDSGLNSLSTVFTLDIYLKKRPDAPAKERILVGRIVTVAAAIIGIGFAFALSSIKDMSLFSMLQALLAFLAPPLAVVFLVGVLWRRATSQAALITLVIGSISSVGIGFCYFKGWPSADFYPHFLLLSFYIFAALAVLMVVITLCTPAPDPAKALSSLKDAYGKGQKTSKMIWVLWGLLSVIMTVIYLIFN